MTNNTSTLRKPLRYNFGVNSIRKAYDRGKQRSRALADVLITIMVGYNSLVDGEIIALCDVLEGSKYGKHGVNGLCRLLRQDIKGRYDNIARTISVPPEDTREAVISRMADTLDSSDCLLGQIVNTIKERVDARMPKIGESAPAEPWLIRQLVLLALLLDFNCVLWRLIKELESYFTQTHKYDWLEMKVSYGRLQHLMNAIRPLNKFGRPLNGRYFAIVEDVVSEGQKKNENDVWEGGLLCDLRDALFDTRFVDRLILARDGKDPHLRDGSRSLLHHGVTYHSDIAIEA